MSEKIEGFYLNGTEYEIGGGTEYNAGEGIEIKNLSDYSAMQGPAPSGFHIPLTTEWQGLKTIMDGLGLTTKDNWRINLHMPFAGNRNDSTADLKNQGSYGNYWSSSPHGSDGSAFANMLYLGPFYVSANDIDARARGFSVRCFNDSYVAPDSNWTVIAGTLGNAGIFRNQTDGLISITSNGTTGYTIQDKNLGATIVYNDGDTLTQANMGNMYQWGNNYGFPSTGTISNTSSTQVDASAYGPGNYYSSSTFITGNQDWSSVHNDNLRGGVTGVVTLDNAITNTGVLSVNGQIGNVTIASPDMSNYLAKDNTTAFTPTGDYQPATKKYVDDGLSGKQSTLTTQTAYSAKGTATKVPQITTNTLGQVTGITEINIEAGADIYYASVYGEMGGHKLGTDTTYEEVKTAYDAGKILSLKYYSTSSMKIYDFDGAYGDTASPQGYMIFYFYSKHDNTYYKIGYSTSGWETLSGNVSSSDVLTKTNTTSYTPSANYHPATKKYVDDKVTVVSGNSGTTYTIKVSSSAPASGTASNVITIVTD